MCERVNNKQKAKDKIKDKAKDKAKDKVKDKVKDKMKEILFKISLKDKVMKTMINYFAVLMLAATIQIIGSGNRLFAATIPQDPIGILVEPSLKGVAESWVEGYNNLYPERVVSLNEYIKGNNNGIVSGHELLFASGNPADGELASSWKMVVARDIVVPVINSNNPMLSVLKQNGVSREQFLAAMNEESVSKGWNILTGEGSHATLSLYLNDDASIVASVDKFFGGSEYRLSAVLVESGEGVIEMVKNNIYAIGFCKLADIAAASGEGVVDGIALLPIDLNGNGTLDYFEDIYANLKTLERGVWIGKYPKSLITNIYAISGIAPTDEAQASFLRWIVTGGQDYLASESLTALGHNERYSRLAGLTTTSVVAVSASSASSHAGRTILIVSVVLAGLLFISFSISYFIRKEEEEVSLKPYAVNGMMDEGSLTVPGGLLYDRTHTWAFMERDGEVRVGIDDFLQKITGKVTNVLMKKPGESITRGEKALTIVQEGKQLDIYSPVSGVVRSANEKLVDNAGKINSSPYNEGWVYLVEPEKWSAEVDRMKDANIYRTWLKDEFVRMRDFLSSLMTYGELTPALVLQDGGEIAENVLSTLDPSEWEEFQTRFIDTSR